MSEETAGDTKTEEAAPDPIGAFKLAVGELGEFDPEEAAKAARNQSKLERIQANMLRIFGAKLDRVYEILKIDLAEEGLRSDTEVWVDLDDGAPNGRFVVLRLEGGDE